MDSIPIRHWRPTVLRPRRDGGIRAPIRHSPAGWSSHRFTTTTTADGSHRAQWPERVEPRRLSATDRRRRCDRGAPHRGELPDNNDPQLHTEEAALAKLGPHANVDGVTRVSTLEACSTGGRPGSTCAGRGRCAQPGPRGKPTVVWARIGGDDVHRHIGRVDHS